tara:strand:- start:11 stop:232 length:222 start_codon:yes stop_codon:yes gene_type:complete
LLRVIPKRKEAIMLNKKITKEMAEFYVPKLENSNEYIEYYTDFTFNLLNGKITVKELRQELILMWQDYTRKGQ